MVRARAKRVGAEACFDDLILADVVDGQFVLLFDLDQEFAELRIVKRLDGFLNQRGGHLLNLLLARFACAGIAASARSSCRSGLTASTRRRLRSLSARPPLALLMACSSSFVMRCSMRASRPAMLVSTSSSVFPSATAWSSFSKATLGFFSSGRASVLSCSQTPTASTMTKWSLLVASGVTALQISPA